MKKIYPIFSLIEVSDYGIDDDIFDAKIPIWLRKEMEKVVKREKVSLRELSYERKIYWSNNKPGWVDSNIISLKTDDK